MATYHRGRTRYIREEILGIIDLKPKVRLIIEFLLSEKRSEIKPAGFTRLEEILKSDECTKQDEQNLLAWNRTFDTEYNKFMGIDEAPSSLLKTGWQNSSPRTGATLSTTMGRTKLPPPPPKSRTLNGSIDLPTHQKRMVEKWIKENKKRVNKSLKKKGFWTTLSNFGKIVAPIELIGQAVGKLATVVVSKKKKEELPTFSEVDESVPKPFEEKPFWKRIKL